MSEANRRHSGSKTSKIDTKQGSSTIDPPSVCLSPRRRFLTRPGNSSEADWHMPIAVALGLSFLHSQPHLEEVLLRSLVHATSVCHVWGAVRLRRAADGWDCCSPKGISRVREAGFWRADRGVPEAKSQGLEILGAAMGVMVTEGRGWRKRGRVCRVPFVFGIRNREID